MTEGMMGIIGIIGLLTLLGLRMPVGMSLLVVGFFGIWALDDFKAATAALASETFSATSSYSMSVIPLFILMGNIAGQAGYSQRLYESAHAWVGHLRGGLASATILGCASFAAVSGSSVATAVTIGKVALPEMKRYGYSDGLATGSVAAGGTLGILIPPSTGFVLYAILTEESIGKLFMAGIIPGLLLTVLFIAVIYVTTLIKPQGRSGTRTTSSAKLTALWRATPLLSVIFISIGGIYFGVFTPEEAAGVGAFLILLMALFSRKIGLRDLAPILLNTVRTTAMLYLIIIGASVFGPFLTLTHIPATLGESLGLLGLGMYGTLLVIVLGYIVLGMFFDGLAMLVITLPIVFPIITGVGFDPIWFGVIAVIVVEMGLITPPVGINVFVVKGIATDVPMATIFKGVLPFWFAMAACLLILTVFPELALFLPNRMQ